MDYKAKVISLSVIENTEYFYPTSIPERENGTERALNSPFCTAR